MIHLCRLNKSHDTRDAGGPKGYERFKAEVCVEATCEASVWTEKAAGLVIKAKRGEE